MAWYPGKHVDKVKRGTARVAEKAKQAEAAVRDGASAREQAVAELQEAYRQAEAAFAEAKAEVEAALQDPANLDMFAKKAEEDAREHAARIELLGQATRELDPDGLKRLSESLLGPGSAPTAADAKSWLDRYLSSSPAWLALLEADDDLHVLSIGSHESAAAGFSIEISGLDNPVAPIYRFDPAERLPYPYREVVAGIGPSFGVDVGLVAGQFRGKANEQWGFFTVVSLHFGDPVSLNVDLTYELPDGDLDGISVGVNFGEGAPFGTVRGIGRTMRLPAEYLLGAYEQPG